MIEQLKIAYRPREAAEMISISVAELYILMNSGAIANYHIGRARFISHASLTAFVESKEASADISDGSALHKIGRVINAG